MSGSRQLASIMFTDIVAYSNLMSKDEIKAFELLNLNRDLHKRLIKKHEGNWIKEMGDGVLASFPIITSAVQCAMELQASSTEIDGLKLRIGIHVAEIVIDHDDVFGNGVNIASRLQTRAPIGGILVSESVYMDLINKKEVQTRFVGVERFKNIEEPIKVYEILPAKKPSEQSSNAISINNSFKKTIAVLPFANMSGDPEQEYFSDGMSEEILNYLSQLTDLEVAGRTSSGQFKGKNLDLQEIGRKLGVSSILEGSVRKIGNRLKVNARLVKVENGFYVWAENYERTLDDVFEIQREIAVAITEKLKATLLKKEKDILPEPPTENQEAYDLYLKGRFFWNRRGPFLGKALEYFQKAIELDPEYAQAHAGIADTFALLGFYAVLPPHRAMPMAKKAAEKALLLDGTIPEALTVLAFVTAFYEWNWKEAKRQFDEIIEKNPRYVPVRYWNSLYYGWIEGNTEKAINEAKIAIKLEPLIGISYYYLAVALLEADQYEEAYKISKLSVDIDSSSPMGYRYIGISLGRMKNFPEAIGALQIAAERSGRHQWILADLAWCYAQVNMKEEVSKIFEELKERSAKEFISGLFLASVAYCLGEVELSFEYLQTAFEQKDGQLCCCQTNLWPVHEDAKKDPRFLKIVEQLDFPAKAL